MKQQRRKGTYQERRAKGEGFSLFPGPCWSTIQRMSQHQKNSRS